jgi:hypothetical protein
VLKARLDEVRKLLTGQRVVVGQVGEVGSSLRAPHSTGPLSGHLAASAGLPVVPVLQGCNTHPRFGWLARCTCLGSSLDLYETTGSGSSTMDTSSFLHASGE